MTRRGVLIAAIILAPASVGFADMEGGDGYVDPVFASLVFWWAPDLLIVLGYPGPDAVLEPSSDAVAQSGTVVSTKSAGPGTQSTYVSVSHASGASDDGDTWVETDVAVITSQSSP